MAIPVKTLAAILEAGKPYPTKLIINTAQAVDPSSLNQTLTTQFRLTLNRLVLNYSFRVEWGDGSKDYITCAVPSTAPTVTPMVVVPGTSTVGGTINIVSNANVFQWRLSSLLHTYTAPGIYTVSITQGTTDGFGGLAFEDPAGTGGSQKPFVTKQTDCYKLLEIEQWGATNWQTMAGSFEGCSNMQLTATDTVYCHTDDVLSWDRAFTQCRSLTPFSFVRMEHAKDVTSMFNGAANLAAVDPNLDWGAVTKASFVFVGCSKLLSVPLLNFSAVVGNLTSSFRGLTLITSFPQLDVHGVSVFQDCWTGDINLLTFPLLNFASATSLLSAWSGCTAMHTFTPTVFPNVTNASNAWQNNNSLISIMVTLPKVTNLSSAFAGCLSLNVVPLPDIQTATNLSSMFSGAASFKQNIGFWWPKSATNMTTMFGTSDINAPNSPFNAVSQSFAFDNAAWTKNASTVLANATASPEGSNTADKLRPSVTSTADHSVSQNVPVGSGTTYTAYCCFKAGEYGYGRLVVSNAFVDDVFVNLTTGAIISGAGTVTSLGNGWWKLAVTGVATTATLNVKCQAFSTGAIIAYSGNAANGIFLWGARVYDSPPFGNVTNYDALLTGWTGWSAGAPDPLKTLQSNVPFGGGTSKYDLTGDAALARAYLVTVKGWIISDGGPY